MAEKAVISQPYTFFNDGGTYNIYCYAMVSNGNEGDSFNVGAVATSTNFNPILPSWRTRIANAIKDAAAAHDPSVIVDSVQFPDFSILNV